MNKGAFMNRIRTFVLLSAAAMFPLASSLMAEQQLSANVPFAFSVGNRLLPAGEYRIARHGAFLQIEKRDDHRSVTLVASPGEPSHDGRNFLSFDDADGVLSLRRVVTADAATSVELDASRTKKKAAQMEHQRAQVDEPLH
jgi:hypothetical protein